MLKYCTCMLHFILLVRAYLFLWPMLNKNDATSKAQGPSHAGLCSLQDV